MRLAEYRQDYYQFSGKASDVARTLSFSGIAVVWVFVDRHGNTYQLSRELLIPAALIVASLALDLLQYGLSTAVWGAFARHHERRGVARTAELNAPNWFNWPSLGCFWLKLLLVIVAYCYLLKYLSTLLFP